MPRTLITGATIISMDPSRGDLATGDILIDAERISAVSPSIDRRSVLDGGEIVDAAECIVIPGLINAHLHTWETGLRGVAGDWTLPAYLREIHAGLAAKFTPDDIYIATLVGSLNQINCGTTTLVDWCHNNPTPAHSDRAIDALSEAGIRAVFFHGTPKPPPEPGQKPFWETPQPRGEVERLLGTRFPGSGRLVTLGLAILGPHISTYEAALHDFRLAREFELVASMHCAGPLSRTPDGWERLHRAGLLGRNTNIVHGQPLSDRELAFMVEAGVTFSLAPETEMTEGHGFPITGRLRKLGANPSLGVDIETAFSGDLFTAARMALASQRALDNEAARRTSGEIPDCCSISCREALQWLTVEGARMLRMEHRIGSLTPGKQADLVVIRADGLNMCPVHDPLASVILHTSIANIQHVMIAGRFRKRNGTLLYPNLAARKQQLYESGHRILDAM